MIIFLSCRLITSSLPAQDFISIKSQSLMKWTSNTSETQLKLFSSWYPTSNKYKFSPSILTLAQSISSTMVSKSTTLKLRKSTIFSKTDFLLSLKTLLITLKYQLKSQKFHVFLEVNTTRTTKYNRKTFKSL